MSKPNLKVVGEITPPDYKDPVKMLRNIADNIEKGDHGDINTLVVALWGDEEIRTFGGGKDSDMFHCTYLFGAAHTRLLNIPWGEVD
jgi:hypothetical protein